MPYIGKVERDRLHSILQAASKEPIANAGNLNYLITRLCQQFLSEMPESYGAYNEVIGALEAAKLELYRRQVSSYEEFKRNLNGEVYDTREE